MKRCAFLTLFVFLWSCQSEPAGPVVGDPTEPLTDGTDGLTPQQTADLMKQVEQLKQLKAGRAKANQTEPFAAWLDPHPWEERLWLGEWKTYTVRMERDSDLSRVHAVVNLPWSIEHPPVLEIASGPDQPDRDYCPAEYGDRTLNEREHGDPIHLLGCEETGAELVLYSIQGGRLQVHNFYFFSVLERIDFSDAIHIRRTSETRGSLSRTDEIDYFRVVVNDYGILIAYSESETDLVGTMYNADGIRIAFNDDGPDLGLDFYMSYGVEPGVYYIGVKLLSEGEDFDIDTISYTLHVDFSQEYEEEYEE